jgi:two-component system, NarL family, nitrate/nitrite response regulator NarL
MWRKNLSPRESEVALLVARGFSNKEVARELELSNTTVKTHVHSILQKLGAKNRYNLTHLAAESRLAAVHPKSDQVF